MQPHAVVGILMVVQRITAKDLDGEAGFFLAFADSGCFRALTRFDFSAWELPQSCQCRTRRSLADEELAVVFYDGNGDFRRHVPIP
jgi:hypothetical protein